MSNMTSEHKKSGGRFAVKFAFAASFVLVVALLIFVLQNTIHTTINFALWSFDIAQGISLLAAAAVGAAVALIISAAFRLRRAVR